MTPHGPEQDDRIVGTRQGALAFGITFAFAVLVFYVLASGKDVLIPLAVAVVVWYVIIALTDACRQIPWVGPHLPQWLRMLSALLAILGVLTVVVNLISTNVAAVTEAIPVYQDNLIRLLDEATDAFGLLTLPDFGQLAEALDLGAMISSFAGTAATLAGATGIVIVFVVFLLFEQSSFDSKMRALFPDKRREQEVRRVLLHMQNEIRTYISVKTLTSALTGLLSYGILLMVGVDFAGFWAFLIFLLNYIPTIGSMVATVFPALLALVQFPTPLQAIVVIATIGLLQFFIGSLLEPRLMGHTLNMSPLVVVLSLLLWGSIWGIAGAFLSVPLTAIVLIAFQHFQPTRPIAILLSRSGRLD
ncbi:MAG: AI-2E family transporter [Dehalococcoidia bacterium]